MPFLCHLWVRAVRIRPRSASCQGSTPVTRFRAGLQAKVATRIFIGPGLRVWGRRTCLPVAHTGWSFSSAGSIHRPATYPKMRNRPQLGKVLPIRPSVPIPSFAEFAEDAWSSCRMPANSAWITASAWVRSLTVAALSPAYLQRGPSEAAHEVREEKGRQECLHHTLWHGCWAEVDGLLIEVASSTASSFRSNCRAAGKRKIDAGAAGCVRTLNVLKNCYSCDCLHVFYNRVVPSRGAYGDGRHQGTRRRDFFLASGRRPPRMTHP
jgi:hypothetical protein